MPTNVTGVTTNFFPTAQNGFTTTTSGSVSSGATTVPLASVAGYTNGETIVLVIDPTDPSKKQTFTGIVDTAGTQITSVKWTAGTNQIHALGATVVDYETATHWALYSKGIGISHDPDGTLKAGAVDVTAVLADGIVTKDKLSTAFELEHDTGWNLSYGGTTVPAPNTITNNGNRSYDMVFNSVDLTGYLSEGMRLRTTRTVSAPTQCADLESSSSQYFSATSASLAGMTFTDDFTCSAWVKLESYTAGSAIVSRYNGTSGWQIIVDSSGRVQLQGFNAGAANYRLIRSYQSLPLNKWVHVAGQLDMSAYTATTTTCYLMIDGVDVPGELLQGGTNPTALVQAGDLNIGGANSTLFFDGKIAQVAIFGAKVTQATMRGYMSQGLAGTETNLVSAFSCNNSLLDLNTTNNNDLTANGGALMTNVDSPFGNYLGGTLDYGIITKTAFSTNTTLTVQVPEGCTIPTSGGVSAVAYSTQETPYGFVLGRGRWVVEVLLKSQQNSGAIVSSATITGIVGMNIQAPIGNGELGFGIWGQATHAGVANLVFSMGLSTTTSSFTDGELVTRSPSVSTSVTEVDGWMTNNKGLKNTALTTYYLNVNSSQNNTLIYYNGIVPAGKIWWMPAGVA